MLREPNIDLSYKDKHGTDVLHVAARNCWQCVELLTTVPGLDWNSRDCHGFTPLYVALAEGMGECVRIIIQVAGVDLGAKSYYGDSLIRAAVEGGNVSCVQMLAKRKEVDMNEKNSVGDTPVLTALRENKTEVLQALINIPTVDLTIRDIYGKSLLILTREHGNHDLAGVFSKFCPNPQEQFSYFDIKEEVLCLAEEKQKKEPLLNFEEYKDTFLRANPKVKISRRRKCRLIAARDWLQEMERRLLIDPKNQVLGPFLHLSSHLQSLYPTLFPDSLLDSIRNLDLNIVHVYFEKGPDKKCVGFMFGGGYDNPPGNTRGIFVTKIEPVGQAMDFGILREGEQLQL